MITIKKFNELTTLELYKILKIRSEVFVVEQECIYNDIDEKDLKSIHMWIENEGEIAAYIRVVEKGLSYPEPSIGRVLVASNERGKGYAKKIVKEGIRYITEVWKEDKIIIGAQVYLNKFYTELGFKQTSEEYDEDGIPHMDMQYTK